jgi:Phage integrase family.
MLTDTAIRKAQPKPKEYRMTDGRGLYLLVTPSGGKLWRWKYRFEGREKKMTFGSYPDMPLLDARERHAAGRRVLAAGVDPMEQRKAEKTERDNSFKHVAALWLETWKADKSERHVRTTEQRLNDHVYPVIGHLSLDAIDAGHVVKVIKAVEAKGISETARRIFEVISQVYRYAIPHGLAKRNPAGDFKPSDVLKPFKSRNLARIDGSALPGLLRAIEVYRGKVVTRLAMRLMALTFPRTAEMIGGRWSEIDWQARRWNIPRERMKMETPHIIPLSTQAIEVLALADELRLAIAVFR